MMKEEASRSTTPNFAMHFSRLNDQNLSPTPRSKSRYPARKRSPSVCLVDSIISLCSRGQLRQAVDSLGLLSQKGLRLNCRTISFLLRQCAKSRALREGRWVHLHLKVTGQKHHPSTMVWNHLINMYFSCGEHDEARRVFDKMSVRNLYTWNNALSGYAKLGMLKPARKLFDQMPEKDVVSWNTMVIGYAQIGEFDEAFRLYGGLRRALIPLNAFSFAGPLIVCVKREDLRLTWQIHGQLLLAGFHTNVVLSSSILDSYAKCGEMVDARAIFNGIPARDVFVWTALISGYARWGDMKSAREMFDVMPLKNPVSWTAIISGYARNSLGHEALNLFRQMMQLQVQPVQYTFSSCLSASGNIAALKHGKQIHAYMFRTGLQPNVVVVSSLIDMYSKCGSLELCKRVFELLEQKPDVVLWNPMLSALAQHGHGEEALRFFDDMVTSRVKPNRVTFVVLLNACSHCGLIVEGISLFQAMSNCHGVCPDAEHYSCLVDLLGRSGRFDELMHHLERMPCKTDERVWNSLVGVCSIHGNLELGRKAAERVIELNPQSHGAYLLLMTVHAASGNWEAVQKLRQHMNQRSARKELGSSWIDKQNEG